MVAGNLQLAEPGVNPPTLLLSRDLVSKQVGMLDALTTVEAVFKAHGEGRVAMPPKITLDLSPFGLQAWTNAMPAFVEPSGAAGIKWAGGYPENPAKHGLPYVIAVIVLQEPATGYPLAVLEGGLITSLRTAAQAAVSAKYLARRGWKTLAVIGAGVQGAFVLEAFASMVPPMSVTISDVAQHRAEALAQTATARYGIHSQACASVEAAVCEADVVVTVTTADAPLVRNTMLRPGCTYISMGSFQEFEDEAVLQADKIFVDSWAQCSHRGELKRLADSGRITRDNIQGEIGEVVAGKIPGRESDAERILVVPIGMGSHDLALAKVAYDRVKATEGVPFFAFL